MPFQRVKKFTATIFLAVFVFYSVIDFVVSAEPAQAQIPVSVTADITKQVSDIKDMITEGWKIAVINSVNQAVAYFMKKVAYDSAVWLASGGKGQNGFQHKTGFFGYVSYVAGEAAGQAIDSLGKGFGLDLCKIPDLKLDLSLRIGYRFNYGAPSKPVCDFNTFLKAWDGDAWKSKYGGANGAFDPGKVFSGSLSIDNTDLGVTLKTTEKLDRLVAAQTNAAKADRNEGGGFSGVLGKVDNTIKNPGSFVKDKAADNTDTAQKKRDQAQIGAGLASGMWQTLPSTMSLFLNTLAGEMLKNFKESGMLPGGICLDNSKGLCKTNNGSVALDANGNGLPSGREQAEAMFSSFLVAKLDSIDNYDANLLADLNSCTQKGLYNCRIDAGLNSALQESRDGVALTIAEAMQKGWLHKDWKVIPYDGREGDNISNDCSKKYYCYGNIKVLRQLRIFPLGFELAAARSNFEKPSTLEEVVRGYYDCDYKKDNNGNVIGINYDPTNHPFCHLVDPNWVIKLPETRCDSKGPGMMQLGDGLPNRVSECADIKSCVGYTTNPDGSKTCAGYGYCAREKNVWKFEAAECSAQYASCKAFTDSSGSRVAYLMKTLDTEGCSQKTVGCKAYSLTKTNGEWTEPQGIINPATGVYINTSVHLNKNVSTDCLDSAVGCSAFKTVRDDSPAYLKKAPDYLKCYDTNPATYAVNWPQTFSDLSKLTTDPACKNYAQACIADEVGCQEYKLADLPDAFSITGKFSPASITTDASGALKKAWNDECDKTCVGYDAYKEMPTDWSPGQSLSYILPPSAKYNPAGTQKSCNLANVGCSSFTNMGAVENGGEKVENFTMLRSCEKPGQSKQKNFYTYETIKTTGYQLRTYQLVEAADGSPSTTFATAQQAADAEISCNSETYKSHPVFNGDCHEISDDQGHVYYKLLSHTIVVSDQCASFRLNSNELAGPNQCFGNGLYKDGFCYYNGLPTGVTVVDQQSTVCKAEMVSCREYRGSASNILKTINSTNFEDKNYDISGSGWQSSGGGVAISSESTQANGHSLEYAGNDTLTKDFSLDTISLANSQVGLNYTISFWIKGAVSTTLEVGGIDGNGTAVKAGEVSPNTNWQNVKFNFTLNSTGESGIGKIYFKMLGGSSNIFIDNLQLTQINDYLYLVKDSLNVPAVCDSHPEDNLPGEALGCTAYSPKLGGGKNPDIFLTNFSFLCRDGAVGCNAFKDTFNTVDDVGPRVYNVKIDGNSGQLASAVIGGKTYSCQVEAGKSSCLVTKISGPSIDDIKNVPGVHIDESTYYVPADTAANSPIYLVASPEAQCEQANLGCMYAGVAVHDSPTTTVYQTTTIKLLPDQFEDFTDANQDPHDGILCKKEADGCGDFGGSYFKDPIVAGNKICEFREKVLDANGALTNGWFIKGTNNTPCYPDYLKNGNYYDIWSFGNAAKYQGYVGACPAAQDSCAEFVDHADKNRSYFYLDNELLSDRDSNGDCSGQVSQKAGCILLDQVGNPNKLYDTAATYLLSDKTNFDKNNLLADFTKVKPVSTASNDANRIVKVSRDRECSEWYQCAASESHFDEKTGKNKTTCEKIGRCDQLSNSTNPGDSYNCGHYIQGNHELTGVVLSESVYALRTTTWSGKDFDGFSIVGMLPLEELNQYDVSNDPSKPDFRLAKKINCGTGDICNKQTITNYDCVVPKNSQDISCGVNGEGLCLAGYCLIDPSGKTAGIQSSEVFDAGGDSKKQICRAYPEVDSPFPNSLSVFNDQLLTSVNRCYDTETDRSKNV